MQRLKQSDPRAAFRRIYFTCVDTTALQTRLQATDMSTFTCYLAKNGGTPALITGSAPVEVGATNEKGVFYVELAAADIDTVGHGVLVITNTAGTKVMEKREIVFAVDQAFFATAATGTLSASAFTSNRTEASSFWVDALVVALTGSLAGQVKKIGAFANASGLFTLATGLAFTAAPANGDIFEIVVR